MAKQSIGTLAAKLTVDTNGWMAGFSRAAKQVDGFASRTEKTLKGISRAFGKTALAGAAMYALHRAANLVGDSLARVEKQAGLLDVAKDAAQAEAAINRMGLAVGEVGAKQMSGLVQKLRETQSVLAAIRDKIVEYVTPAVDAMLTGWNIGLELVAKRVEDIGFGLKEWVKSSGAVQYLGGLLANQGIVGKAARSAAGMMQGMADQNASADKFRANARDTAKPAVPPAVADAAKAKAIKGTQSPYERGTTAAAVAVMEMGGNPLGAVEKNTEEMLKVLVAIRDKEDKKQIGRARINK